MISRGAEGGGGDNEDLGPCSHPRTDNLDLAPSPFGVPPVASVFLLPWWEE